MTDAVMVPLKDLHDLPVSAKNASHKLVKIIAGLAKSSPDEIRPVPVGKVKGKMYVLDQIETVLGLKSCGIKSAAAIVTEYSSVQDLLVAHVRTNFHPQILDPLKVRDVVQYMIKQGTGFDDACDALWLDKRPDLYSIVSLEIADKAKDVLVEMLDEISKKMYFVVTPHYYITKLAKITKEEQYNAALEIKSVTIPKMSVPEKSSWPSAETIDSTLTCFHKLNCNVPVEARISQSSDVQDLAKKKNKSAPSDPKTVKKAAKYIADDPNLIYVPMEGKQPDLLVNKKTGRVATASEKHGLYSITDDRGKTTHLIPDNYSVYLDMDNNNIQIGKYTIEKLPSILSKFKDPQARCLLLTVKSPAKKD